MIDVGRDWLDVRPEQPKELGHLLARRPLAKPRGQCLVAGDVPVNVVGEKLGDGVGIAFGEASIERLYDQASSCCRIDGWHRDLLPPSAQGSGLSVIGCAAAPSGSTGYARAAGICCHAECYGGRRVRS